MSTLPFVPSLTPGTGGSQVTDSSRLPDQVWTLGLSVSAQRTVEQLLAPTGVTVHQAYTAAQCPPGPNVVWVVERRHVSGADLHRAAFSAHAVKPPIIALGGLTQTKPHPQANDTLWEGELRPHLIAAIQGRHHLWKSHGLNVQVMGKPQVSCGTVPLNAPQKTHELLYHLLALPYASNAMRQRHLWPQENDQERSRNNLHINVHRLRQALGKDALECQQGHYTLQVEVRCDASIYSTDPRFLSPVQLGTLVDLYQPYLEGMDAPWITEQRMELHARHRLHRNLLQRTQNSRDSLPRDPFMDIIV